MTRATVFAPGSIGNVGPGFDVLGLAVGGLGDLITVELVQGESSIGAIKGRDADLIPRDPARNCAAVAALSLLKRIGDKRAVRVSFDRALPLAGGLGASAAASVGGALAAAFAADAEPEPSLVLTAALDGEESVAGRHLDNIAPCLFGGLALVLKNDPPDALRLPVRGEWGLAVVSPGLRLATKDARSVLPASVPRGTFVAQMAHTAALAHALGSGDHGLAQRALHDHFAEPARAPLIKGFHSVKAAALKAGALGCSISGAGPSVFALCPSVEVAAAVGQKMQAAFAPLPATLHVGPVANQGAERR